MWMVKKDESPLVDANGKESLNFQISVIIYTFICIITIIGILLLIPLIIFEVVMPIIAAVKTNNGEEYKYPMTIRFIK